MRPSSEGRAQAGRYPILSEVIEPLDLLISKLVEY